MGFFRTFYFIIVSIAFAINIIYNLTEPSVYGSWEFLQDFFTLLAIIIGMMIKD